MSAVIVKEFITKAPDRREILRYMGCKESSAEIEGLIDRAIREADGKIGGKVCYRTLDISRRDGGIDLGFALTESRDLKKALAGCDRVVLFAATIGLELDRLIYRYGRTSPSLALCLQALGAERIEALCDEFCAFLTDSGLSPRPRFSAGYGDLPLELQKDIFRALDCSKQIGLTLNDSLLMSPTKSVTAIVGIK
jgi:hypothetical protein